jgi:hypothetical protein
VSLGHYSCWAKIFHHRNHHPIVHIAAATGSDHLQYCFLLTPTTICKCRMQLLDTLLCREIRQLFDVNLILQHRFLDWADKMVLLTWNDPMRQLVLLLNENIHSSVDDTANKPRTLNTVP